MFLAVSARSNLVYLESGPNVYFECVQHWYILTIYVSVVLSMPHAIRRFFDEYCTSRRGSFWFVDLVAQNFVIFENVPQNLFIRKMDDIFVERKEPLATNI
jgi:hypothetical protein